MISAKLVRSLLSVALLASPLAAGAWMFPGQSHPGNSARSDKHQQRQEIEQLEMRWHDAILKGDAATIGSLLADDFIGISADGTLQTKDQLLAAIRSGQEHFTRIDVFERKIRFYGTTALVTALINTEGVSPDGPLSGQYRYTRVYARDPKGIWKIVNFEISRLHEHKSPS